MLAIITILLEPSDPLFSIIEMKNTIIILIRICLGLIFFSSGMAKLFAEHKFPGVIGPVWLEEELSRFGLALYARFVAYAQVIIGFLLLTQRFATLGALMLFPMILNILMVTVSLEWKGTPWVNLALLAMNLVLLIGDYHRIKFLFSDEPAKLKKIDADRNFPFHDLVFLIGMFMVMITPFISRVSHFLAYFLVVLGCGIGFGIQYYEQRLKRSLKEMNRNFFE